MARWKGDVIGTDDATDGQGTVYFRVPDSPGSTQQVVASCKASPGGSERVVGQAAFSVLELGPTSSTSSTLVTTTLSPPATTAPRTTTPSRPTTTSGRATLSTLAPPDLDAVRHHRPADHDTPADDDRPGRPPDAGRTGPVVRPPGAPGRGGMRGPGPRRRQPARLSAQPGG